MSSVSVVNGQIFTPGLAIIDAPQPYTPLGGDILQVAIEVSGDGKLELDAGDKDPTAFHDIRLFLTSDEKERNFTISNGTTPDSHSQAYVGPILDLEPGSTVKHVNWIWPECFVGEGEGSADSARGNYNISIHQSFRYDGDDYYTIAHLPIAVSNGIEKSDNRTDCALLQNEFQPAVEAASNGTLAKQPWGATGGNVTDPNTDNGGSSQGVGVKQLALVAMVMSGIMLL